MTTTVDHSRDHDLAVQGSQAARARAIVHLIEDNNLPTIDWSIGTLTELLRGTIYADLGEGAEQQRAKVTAWARFLGAKVTETAVARRTELVVEAWAHGVRVHISGTLRPTRAELIREVAEDENAERITPREADRRILERADRDLTPEQRSEAYEQLREALAELDRVRSDMWDPAEGDRELAEHAADACARAAIDKLTGGRK